MPADVDKANLFLLEFVGRITSEFPTEIECILLAGSVPRGDFRIGQSDIDLTIKVRCDGSIDRIRARSNEIFWSLDSIHGLGLRELHEKKKGKGQKNKLAGALRIRGPKKHPKTFMSFLLNDALSFDKALMRHARVSGKVLYGNDFIKEMPKEENSVLGTFMVYHLFLSSISIAMFPLFPDDSLRRSMRARIFGFEDEFYSPGSRNHLLVKEAISMKVAFDDIRKEWGLLEKASYCISTFCLICLKNMGIIWRMVKGGRGDA